MTTRASAVHPVRPADRRCPVRAAAEMMTAVLGLASAGCIASHNLAEGELTRYTSAQADTADLGPYYRPSVGGRRLPGKWVVRRHPSLIWATISLVRAGDRLKAEPEEIELAVSLAHATALANVLADARLALQDVADISEMDREADRKRWARGVAAALVRVEAVARRVTTHEPDAPTAKGEEPLGMAAGPMLEMVAGYLNERSGGHLLGDLALEDLGRARALLVQAVLRLGFAAAGRRLPDDLRDAIQTPLRDAENLKDAVEPLAEMLLARVVEAPPEEAGSGLSGTLRTVLTYAPKALLAVEKLARQWDRVEALEFEFHRKDEHPVVVVTVRVQPGQEVRLDDLILFQPAIVFRGASRIVVQPKLPGTGETVVAFEPVGDGAVDLRFEGVAYGLARLLVMPLASGALREVRVFAKTRQEGDQIINVALLMEAAGEKGDPRRLLHFQDVRHKRLLRGPFELRSVVEGKEQVFNYLTPDRRYTFRRVKTPQDR